MGFGFIDEREEAFQNGKIENMSEQLSINIFFQFFSHDTNIFNLLPASSKDVKTVDYCRRVKWQKENYQWSFPL